MNKGWKLDWDRKIGLEPTKWVGTEKLGWDQKSGLGPDSLSINTRTLFFKEYFPFKLSIKYYCHRPSVGGTESWKKVRGLTAPHLFNLRH